ncbi:TMM81 protein, partial [Grallaria varia]|nr:TMM81 protein [Grallaria varia]
VSIPPELRSAVIKIALNATPCSVTCGVGIKVEEMCEITPAGERRNCSLVRSLCLSTWMCGLHHISVPVGHPIRLRCLLEDLSNLGNHTYSFTWRWAPGLITTNDLLFQPLENLGAAFSLASATEADAGTYCCDMRIRESIKLIKRIYFGLRVIPRDLVDLNFQKSLTWEQKLVANLEDGSAGNGSREGQEHFWEKGVFYEAMLGIGSGVLGGFLVSLMLCC